MNWLFFTEQLLKEIFNQFMPNKNIKFPTNKNIVITTSQIEFITPKGILTID